jgi:hypothetical protein
VPVFVTLGNHDYRLNPYWLLCNVAVPGADPTLRNYASHNLTEADARVLQGGGYPTLHRDTAKRMATVDRKLAWYRKCVSSDLNYTIELGPHRVVCSTVAPTAGPPTRRE